MRDADGDGHLSAACGGDDCDDADRDRYTDNVETCVGDGGLLDSHDEDCDDRTVGELDRDGDGYVSAACSNGHSGGSDCDDNEGAVHPDITEMCDGIDNDCSGTADDSSSLCPGGTCSAGRCRFRSWNRTFGSAWDDIPDDVVIDSRGNVFVLGTVGDTTDFGDGIDHETQPGTVFVIKYRGADGLLEWVYTSPQPSTCRNVRSRLAVAADGSVYFVGFGCGIDYGSGTAVDAAVVVQLTPDGTYARSVRLGPCSGSGCLVGLYGITVGPDTVTLVGVMSGSYDFGDGMRDAGSWSGLVLQLDSSLAFRRAQLTPASGGWIWPREIVRTVDGGFLIGGQYNGEYRFGGGSLPSTPPASNGDPDQFEYSDLQNTFVVRVDEDFSPIWAHGLSQVSATPASQSVLSGLVGGPDGTVALVGQLAGQIDFGGPAAAMAEADEDGFIVALDPDGGYRWARTYDMAFPHGIAASDSGSFTIAGRLDGPTSFGAGTIALPVGTTSLGFLLTLDSSGRWAGEQLFGAQGRNDVTAVSIGPGDATQVVGSFQDSAMFESVTRLSVGRSDVFVFRPAF